MRTALLAAVGLFVSSTAFAGHGHHTRPAPRPAPARVVYVAPAPVVVYQTAPRADVVWVDGYWQGRYWVPGHWEQVSPPPPQLGVSIGVGGVHVAVNTR